MMEVYLIYNSTKFKISLALFWFYAFCQMALGVEGIKL